MKIHWLKIFFLCLIIVLFSSLIPVFSIKAACPVCVVALPAAAGLALWLGIDRLIIGFFLGGLIILFIQWLISLLKKKSLYFKFAWLLISILMYLAVIISLFLARIIPAKENQACGLDKLLLGIFFGSIFLIIIFSLQNFLNKQILSKALKPAQGFIIIILFLIILTFIYPVFFQIICYLNNFRI